MDSPRHRSAVALLVAALLAAAAACTGDPAASGSGGADPNATVTTTAETTTAPSSSPADVAGEAALSAYRGMWEDFAHAGRTSDWESDRLDDHATKIALTNMSRALYADKRNGLVTKGEPILRPKVESATPEGDPVKVIVTDCGDSSKWLKYDAETGEKFDGAPGGEHRINAVVEKQDDGTWLVTDYGVHEVGSC